MRLKIYWWCIALSCISPAHAAQSIKVDVDVQSQSGNNYSGWKKSYGIDVGNRGRLGLPRSADYNFANLNDHPAGRYAVCKPTSPTWIGPFPKQTRFILEGYWTIWGRDWVNQRPTGDLNEPFTINCMDGICEMKTETSTIGPSGPYQHGYWIQSKGLNVERLTVIPYSGSDLQQYIAGDGTEFRITTPIYCSEVDEVGNNLIGTQFRLKNGGSVANLPSLNLRWGNESTLYILPKNAQTFPLILNLGISDETISMTPFKITWDREQRSALGGEIELFLADLGTTEIENKLGGTVPRKHNLLFVSHAQNLPGEHRFSVNFTIELK